jgi:hypothetical protein
LKKNVKNWVIWTHHHFHPDEAVAIWELLRFGEGKRVRQRRLNGISKAKIKFGEAGEIWSIPLENTNIITVGTGRQLFDEHITAPRKDRIAECAATLVAKELNLSGTELKRLLNYVYFHDTRGRHVPLDLADFIISLHFFYTDQEVLQIALKILDALFIERKMTQKDRDLTRDFIEKWLEDKNGKTATPIVKFANGLRHGNRSDFDFTEIFVKLIQKYGREEAEKLAILLLETKYHRQEVYFEAEKLVQDPEITGNFMIKRKDREFSIVYTKKPVDNREYSRAARGILRADIVIQKNSNGRVLILPNLKTPIKKELRNIVAMLRLEEMKVRGLPLHFSLKRLTYGGMLPEVPYWYFQIEPTPAGGKILNGSTSAREVEPTKIPFERIITIVKTAMKLGYYFKWPVWVRKNIDSRIYN